jgi:hypothetical protein
MIEWIVAQHPDGDKLDRKVLAYCLTNIPDADPEMTVSKLQELLTTMALRTGGQGIHPHYALVGEQKTIGFVVNSWVQAYIASTCRKATNQFGLDDPANLESLAKEKGYRLADEVCIAGRGSYPHQPFPLNFAQKSFSQPMRMLLHHLFQHFLPAPQCIKTQTLRLENPSVEED